MALRAVIRNPSMVEVRALPHSCAMTGLTVGWEIEYDMVGIRRALEIR